jgi:ribonuclease VapC
VIEAVLDASAVLANIRSEPGAELVRSLTPRAAISAVNFAEVITKLIEFGMPEDAAVALAASIDHQVVPADQPAATSAGLLHAKTRRTGVSLGDRFCLALAQALGVPAITADRRWATLDLGVEITLIR